MAAFPPACIVCGALLVPGAIETHVQWHANTGSLDGWPAGDAARVTTENYNAVTMLAGAGDDAPTAKLPPISDTVRRRPPVPPTLRDLPAGSAELFRALADAIAEDEDLNTAERKLWPPCKAHAVGGRVCTWPDGTPCLTYGIDGCGMKAQES